MKLHVSNIEESYKDTIIGHLVNSDISYLLLQIVQCWRECAVNEENQALLVKFCHEVHYMSWEDRELRLQESGYFIKSNKTRILALIMLVQNNNPKGYKQHVIYFIYFSLEKVLISYIG